MKQKFWGAVPPLPTPIDRHERVDEKALRLLVDHCVEKGLHGLFVCGTNGESMALTQRERNRAIQIVLDQAAGRVPVMAGCMDTSTKRVIENVKACEQMGVKSVVVTAEFYARHSCPGETVRHFEEIAKNTEADLFLYNIPPFVGTALSAETVFQIAKIDHVVGYKDSGGVFGEFLRCLEHFAGTDFMLFQGVTQLAGASVLMGAAGFVPNIAPAVPELCIQVYECAKRRDMENLAAYSALLTEAQRSLLKTTNAMAGCKALCAGILGFMSPDMCLPGEPVKEAELAYILKTVRSVEERRLKLEEKAS